MYVCPNDYLASEHRFTSQPFSFPVSTVEVPVPPCQGPGNLLELAWLVRRSESEDVHTRSAAAGVEGSIESAKSFLGPLQLGLQEFASHRRREERAPSGRATLLDLLLEIGDVGFRVDHL